MLRYPGHIPAGRRIEAQVRIIDIMPTILELVHLPVPAGLDGRSFAYLMPPGIQGVLRTSFSETLFSPTPAFQLSAVSDGRYKLIRSEAGDRWLFDLEQRFHLAAIIVEPLENHPRIVEIVRACGVIACGRLLSAAKFCWSVSAARPRCFAPKLRLDLWRRPGGFLRRAYRARRFGPKFCFYRRRPG